VDFNRRLANRGGFHRYGGGSDGGVEFEFGGTGFSDFLKRFLAVAAGDRLSG